MSDSPSPIGAAYSLIKALRVSRPRPSGSGSVAHSALGEVLQVLSEEGVVGLVGQRDAIRTYRDELQEVDPDSLARADALAYWLNLYNAGALDLAAESQADNRPSVLRVPGAFDRRWATVMGEELSLSDIEHGKIRRFGDPRIHSALVCGSASCPTLRLTPYDSDDLGGQLETQMRSFMAGGGAVVDGDRLMLSRIFLWYGSDFVRPNRMPSLLPTTKRSLRQAISQWLDPETTELAVEFQSYDWGLACSVG